MSRRAIIGVLGGYLWALSGGAGCGENFVRGQETVQWMIAQERAWAEHPVETLGPVRELLATDFHGTSPKEIVTIGLPKCRRTIQRHSTAIAASSMRTSDSW